MPGALSDRIRTLRPIPLLAALALLVLFQLAPALFQFQRTTILQGEIWRLLTDHWVHLGWAHLLYNGVGLTGYWLLFGRHLTARELAWLWLSVSLAVSLGLLLFTPDVTMYVGLSGVLHGVFAHAAIRRLRGGWWDGGYLLALLVAKVIWEQSQGPLPGTAATIGGAVIVDAHLYGLVAGVAAAMADVALRNRSSAG